MRQFFPTEWQKSTGISADGAPIGLCIGPLDALNIMAERESLTAAGFDFGRRVPTDVFLFGLGEPDARESTKIGGLPFLHRGDDWPRNSAGEALPFIGQINFADSTEVLGVDLPGDVLLVFGNLPAKWRSVETEIRWKRSSDFSGDELLEADEIPVPSPSDVFYGVRWRTYNFPDAAKNPKNRTFYATTTYDASSAASIFATQISSAPFCFARRSSGVEKETLVCCIAPVLPTRDGSFSFFNCEQSLRQRSGLRTIYDERHRFIHSWLTKGDGASIFVFRNEKGEFSVNLVN